MLKAKHHFLLYPLLRFYVISKLKRSFKSINIIDNLTDKGLPVLLICNHISWWDGIWSFQVNRLLFKRKFFFMMQEEQLKKNWFFNYTGGFPVSTNPRKAIDSIHYAAELLKNPNNLVLLFPQGKIESMHRHEFVFQKGIERLANTVNNDIQLVFLACLVDYYSFSKPTVNAYLSLYSESYTRKEIQGAYNNFYNSCLLKQLQI